LGDQPWALSSDNEFAVLMKFIECVRIQKRMHVLEMQLAENARKIATPIIAALPSSIIQAHHYAFVHVHHNGDQKVFGVCVQERKNRLDSQLVKLIGSLCAQGISIKYLGFLHLLFQPPYKMSHYEEGVLTLMNVSMQTKVATHETYKEIVESQHLVASPHAMPMTAVSSFYWIEPKTPDHFNRFKPITPYDFLPELENFTIENEDIYMNFAMRLVHFFRDESVREHFNLPDGHPIVCLIVSKKGEILSWGLNTREADMTQHAETNALNLYFMQNPAQQYLPEGVRIFTSLKSCHMCSGGIVDCLHPTEVKSAAVIYGQKELGKSNTCLQEVGIERSSKLKINGILTFDDIDKTYEQQKKQESYLKGMKTNAAESLYDDSQTAVLDQITDEFIKNMNATSAIASKIQLHIRSFLMSHGLDGLLVERKSMRRKAGY